MWHIEYKPPKSDNPQKKNIRQIRAAKNGEKNPKFVYRYFSGSKKTMG